MVDVGALSNEGLSPVPKPQLLQVAQGRILQPLQQLARDHELDAGTQA